MLRIARLARTVEFFTELRVLLGSIIDAVQSMGWVVVLLFGVVYMISIFTTQLVTDYKVIAYDRNNHTQSDTVLLYYFDNLEASLVAFWMSVTNGVSYGDLVEPTRPISSKLAYVFCIVESFATLAILNVVQALFVDKFIAAANRDRRVHLSRVLQNAARQNAQNSLDGELTWEEFQAAMMCPKTQKVLEDIGVDAQDVVTLFELIDHDDSGTVSGQELMRGATRLMGGARAIDLALFMHFFQTHAQRLEYYLQQVGTVDTTSRSAVSDSLGVSPSPGKGVKRKIKKRRADAASTSSAPRTLEQDYEIALEAKVTM